MTKSSIRRLAWLYSALLVAIVVAAGCGALPLRLIAGWWKGSAQMVQPMVFGVGGYDVCADP